MRIAKSTPSPTRMAQKPTLTMLSRPNKSCPNVSAIKQDRRRQNAVPTSGSHRRKPAKKIAPTSTIEPSNVARSEEHTSELQSHHDLVCRLLLEKKKKQKEKTMYTKKQLSHR